MYEYILLRTVTMCVTNGTSNAEWWQRPANGNRKGKREGIDGSNRQNKATAGSIARTTYKTGNDLSMNNMEILPHYVRRSYAPIHPMRFLRKCYIQFMRNTYTFVVPFFREFNEPHAFVMNFGFHYALCSMKCVRALFQIFLKNVPIGIEIPFFPFFR